MVAQKKLGKYCKEKMIGEIEARIKDHPSFFITSYMGSSVSDLELLRKNLKKNSSTIFVVKNTNLRVILNKMKNDELLPLVDGGVAVSLSGDDIIGTCKTLVSFEKDHDKFRVRGGMIDGKAVPLAKIKEIAVLPSREILLAQVVGTIKAPITGFVNVMAGILRKFVYAVNAIKEKKEKEK